MLVKRMGRRRSQLHCFCCAGKTGDTSIHHLKPRSEGGTDEPSNLVPLCVECHDAVEGPEDGAWKRIQDRKSMLRRERLFKGRQEKAEAKRKSDAYEQRLEDDKKTSLRNMGVQVDGEPVAEPRLVQLRRKRRARGYLDGDEAREYHTLVWGEESARMYWDASQQDFCKWLVARASKPANVIPYMYMKTNENGKSANSLSPLESAVA